MNRPALLVALSLAVPPLAPGAPAATPVSIEGEQFFVNGAPTCEGRTWNGHRIEGLRADHGERRACYHAEAVFDADGHRLHGRLRISVPGRLLRDGREVRQDLAAGGRDDDGERLTLGPVQASRAAKTTRREGTLVVTLEEPVPADEDVSLSAEFSTRIWGQLEEWLGYPAFWGDQPGRFWYPDLYGPDGARVRFRDFDVSLTYPDDHAVLTSGREVETAVVSGGMRRSRYTAEGVEGFAVNLARGFELYEVPAGDVTVVAMVPPNDREAFRKAAHDTADAVAWYREVYGFFPVARIGIAPGEENPIGVAASASVRDPPRVHRRRLPPMDHRPRAGALLLGTPRAGRRSRPARLAHPRQRHLGRPALPRPASRSPPG